jgi:PAS domain S-box-containing protein
VDTESFKQIHCLKCNKLLAKQNPSNHLEIKCRRCGTLNRTFEQMNEQVIITDPKGKILFINQALEKTTGYSTHEAIGKTPAELWGGQMSKEFYTKIWDTIKKQKRVCSGKSSQSKKIG